MCPWLSQHGYHLNIHFEIEDRCIYSYPQRELKGAEELPYAYLGGDMPGEDPDFASWLPQVELYSYVISEFDFFPNTRNAFISLRMHKVTTSQLSCSRTNLKSTKSTIS